MFAHQLSIIVYIPIYVFVFYVFNNLLSFIFIDIFFNESFIFWFIILFFFLLNYYFWEDKIEYGLESELDDFEVLNYDMFYNFINLFDKNIFSFVNLLIVEFKKIYLFFLKFRFWLNIFSTKNFLKKKFKNFFTLWRPIFKKWSYLGYYRANRSKWIK